ncbi:phospholipase D family protein [Metabacillus sp. KIGAM252]|uniref:Phospholipase D family protein n=1 Tax=Metabacillus flavus TaxID=2823519 RepID=A0ABS5LAP2_9BACI|nr:phospholipase D family protein [Metabacillus flavus]MBS2967792.1 phospholipase D family protein [Metabacillus flavus]
MVNYQWKRGNLVEYFERLCKIKSIRIATAYFSEFGLNLLKDIVIKNKLPKSKVVIFLSTEFSNTSPAFLLKELSKTANVFIVDSLQLHAKVYLVEKEDGDLEFIHGSANLTQGGFQRNLEFMSYHAGDKHNLDRILLFFDYCKNNASLVDSTIIDYYNEIDAELLKLNNLQKNIRKKLNQRITNGDLFERDEYDLTKHYFTYEDYESLFHRNAISNNNEIKERRKLIRDKLASIHKLLKKHVNLLDLHEHWKLNNLTSGIEPNHFNHNRVSWIGVRYGKTEQEVKQLNAFLPPSRGSYTSDEYMGFQKHGCIQFCLVGNGFEIVLFHSVANDAVDRGTMHDIINKPDKVKIESIIREVSILKGKGFTWFVTDAKNDKVIASFSFDKKDAKDFINFYKNYDKPGFESYCSYLLLPDSDILKDRITLAKFTLKKIKQLLPLYQLITFRNKVTTKS